MKKRVPIKNSFRFGWETFKKNPLSWAGVTALVFIPNLLISLMGGQEPNAAITLLSFILTFASVGVMLGIIYISFKAVRGEEVIFSDIKEGFDIKFLRAIGAQILYSIMILIPAVLFIVGLVTVGMAGFSAMFGTGELIQIPLGIAFITLFIGITLLVYLTLRYMFYTYAIAGDNAGIIESLKRSAKITKGAKVSLFIFMIVSALVSLLGALVILVGLLAAIPVVTLATAYVYEFLATGVEKVSEESSRAPSIT